MQKKLDNFINQILDDIHNISPELSQKWQDEYNKNFLNKAVDSSNIEIGEDSIYLHPDFILKNNAMIDEFMGNIYCTKSYAKTLSYHTSFDSLMKVIYKIRSLGYIVTMETFKRQGGKDAKSESMCKITLPRTANHIAYCESAEYSSYEVVYRAIVKAIHAINIKNRKNEQ